MVLTEIMYILHGHHGHLLKSGFAHTAGEWKSLSHLAHQNGAELSRRDFHAMTF